MTRKQFLKKYPLPWSWQQTDRDGGGVLLDANDQLMVRLCPDEDWTDIDGVSNPDNPTADDKRYHRPVMNGEDNESERIALLEFIVDRINAASG